MAVVILLIDYLTQRCCCSKSGNKISKLIFFGIRTAMDFEEKPPPFFWFDLFFVLFFFWSQPEIFQDGLTQKALEDVQCSQDSTDSIFSGKFSFGGGSNC